MTLTERLLHLLREEFNQILWYPRIAGNQAHAAFSLKNLEKLFRTRVVHPDLVRNPAQECFVGQLAWVEIGGECHKHIERDFELPSAGHSKEINMALERGHPAIQKLVGAHPLASEVVQDQNPIVGLQLK